MLSRVRPPWIGIRAGVFAALLTIYQGDASKAAHHPQHPANALTGIRSGGGIAPRVGVLGSSFHLANGLWIRLVSYRQEQNVHRFPGGSVWQPAPGNMIIVTVWSLRNTTNHPLLLERFFTRSRGHVQEGGSIGNAGYANQLFPHESASRDWFFEISKHGAQVFYGPDHVIQHAAAVWVIKR